LTEVINADGDFVMDFIAIEPFATFQCSDNHSTGPDATDVREMKFELVADAR
jgi:hypothetical protein